MQQSYLHVLSSDNNNNNPQDAVHNKNELTKFIHAHDYDYPAIAGKTYLAGAGERDNKQITETKKNEPVIMLDLFGALNY